MRTASFKPLLVLIVLAALGLAACDTNVPQKVEWTSGNDLAIIGPDTYDNDLPQYDGFAPGVAGFYVTAHNLNWTYAWNVNPALTSETLQNGQFFRIEYDQPGTYVVTVETTIEGQSYDDTVRVTIEAPTNLGQIQRLPQFNVLESAVGIAGLGGVLADSTITLLAPTNEAFVARFDEDGDGMVESDEIPAPEVLDDIIGTNIITEEITPEEIEGGATFTTLEGEEVTFQVSGDQITVVVRNDMGEVVSQARITEAGIPVSNGAIYQTSRVLIPGSASVDIMEQTAVDSVVVSGVFLPEGGFVTISDSTFAGLDGEPGTGDDLPQTSVIGVSEKLSAGFYRNIEIALEDSLQADQTLFAIPRRDAGVVGTFDPVTDVPYTDTAGPDDMTESTVFDSAEITIPEE